VAAPEVRASAQLSRDRTAKCAATAAGSADTGAAVLDIVRARGAFLVEDDWAHDLAIDADPRPLVGHDDGGHVIYLRSLTKSVSPALRVAAVIARGPARERILADRAAETIYVSGVLQAAALDVVTQPGWSAHLRGMGQQLRARRDLLLDSVGTHAPQVHVEHVPVGGKRRCHQSRATASRVRHHRTDFRPGQPAG